MKKEYLILTGLILILCAYLFLHKENRDNYTLPAIPEIDIEQITGIVIEKNNTSVTFSKDENKWTLTDKMYPADKYLIDNMLATFKNFNLSTLVSQQGDLTRYALDKKQNIRVKIEKKDKTIFEVAIGKTAPTFNHTFVMLAEDKNVYHATGSFKSHFDKAQDDFRDKTVLSFKKPSIKRFSIEKDKLAKTFILTEEKKEKDEAITEWRVEDGSPADQKLVSDFLSSLTDLDCEKYLDTPIQALQKSTPPLCKIQLKNDEDHELTLYGTAADENKNISGISSMNKYAFALSQYSGNEIVANIEKLLGIKKADDQKE